MANKKITQLPSIGGSLSPSAVLEIAQPNDETTGVSYRATAEQIANQASLWVPQTLTISGAPTTGIVGGGDLSTNRAFSFSFASVPGKTAPVVADSMLINNSGTSLPAQVTLDNFYKTIDGLNTLGIPSLTDDYLAIYHAADGLPYKLSPSALSIASGNVPAGGTTGQFLAKASNADYDTEWSNPSILLDAYSIAANPTASSALGVSVTLGSTLAFSGTTLQTGAGTGDVSWSANSFATTIGNNKVTDAMLRQSSGLSVIGRSASTIGNVADITGTADQVFRVAASGASLGFGSIDLSKSAAVGSSVLGAANGGTGLSTYATGDIIYASAANTLSALSGNTAASIKYLSQTGTGSASQAPAWVTISGGDITGAALTKVDDTNVTLTLGGSPTTALLRAASITAGWTGQLAVGRGGTGLASGTSGGILGFTGSTTLASSVALTANAIVLGGGAGATPVPMASLGTTTTVLHGNAAGAPTFAAVSLTADVSGTLPVGNGGTGIANPTAHDLLIGNGSSAMTQLAPSATSGVPLISQGASADPAYGTAVVAGGGTGATSFTAYSVLCGGTTSTGAVQNVSGVGTSGQVLTSNGAGALPTWQSSAGTGTVTSVATTYPISGGTITSTGTLTSVAPTTSGRLVYTSSTQLTFLPLYGDTIKINGVVYQIPSAGVTTGLTNSGLSDNTLYYVYLYNNSGTLTGEFSATGHSTSTTSGNIGTEIKTGDDTRSLIGMVYTAGATHTFADSATQRCVISWFNRRGIGSQNTLTANRTTTSTSWTEINSEIRIQFVTWGTENVTANGNFAVTNSGTGNTIAAAIGFDGTTPSVAKGEATTTAGYVVPFGVGVSYNGLSEGYHYGTLLGITDFGTATFYGAAANFAGMQSSISIGIRG